MGIGGAPGERKPLIVGLTGGIASGKSAVADLFAGLGAPVLDTDVIAREVVAPGTPGIAMLVERFGADILDDEGALDRTELRARVFADPSERRALEGIVHPLVIESLDRQAAGAGGPYQVHVIPLLVETGLAGRVDRVLVVDCDPAVQLARLLSRDGGGEEQARQMLAAQATREQRLQAADDVLANEGELAALEPLVGRLDRFYRRLARTGEREAPGIRLP
jgi:dephospho-CoA kinase